MPTPSLPGTQQRDRLLALFRNQGYDGTSLADIGQALGMGKSSLYHHFPGGKAEMALAVLAHVREGLKPALGAARAPGDPADRLRAFVAALDAYYDGGRTACLLERLGASVDRHRFAEPLRATFADLAATFEALARDAGRPDAAERAEDAVVRLEGSLVVAAGTDDPAVFTRALARIGAGLLT